MKKITLLSLLILVVQFCFAQNKPHDTPNAKALLEGVSLDYQYENESAIHIEFKDEKLHYKWIAGPNTEKPIRTFSYKSKLLSQGVYFINWHEAELKNFITLVFDFNKKIVSSSVIVKYGDKTRMTTFDKGVMTNIINKNSTLLPYKEIPSYSKDYSSGNILSRFIDGLGYRYYWATEGLKEKDLEFQPSKEGKTTYQTMEHIYGLSKAVLNGVKNQANTGRPDLSNFDFEELRKQTLINLKLASELHANKQAHEIAELKVIFKSDGKKHEYPYWNMINGPLSDALYHTGQIVSFRRSSGNPINPNVNVFLGKTGN